MRADIGIALDGDADRVILVDERGHVVDGDQLLAVIAQSWKEDGRLAKPGIVATVMSNLGLERFLQGHGVELVRTPVGDRYVLEQMLSGGYNLGGEQSGHIILSDYATTGDGFVAALQVLAVVQKLRRPVSEVCHRFDPLPQILKNVRYSQRQAARLCRGQIRDHRRREAPQRPRPPADPPLRHRAGDPRDGRGRRSHPGGGSRRSTSSTHSASAAAADVERSIFLSLGAWSCLRREVHSQSHRRDRDPQTALRSHQVLGMRLTPTLASRAAMSGCARLQG